MLFGDPMTMFDLVRGSVKGDRLRLALQPGSDYRRNDPDP
jgi:hypothetical protein